ncbi:MAG TPA: hypothetical protein VNT79_06655, partial [Phycisphaerae bacterium]|nr:hypothetical protein [Phycisphaerae bacterium]
MNATKRHHPPSSRGAFTLIELLIAASATALTATTGAAMIFAVSSASTQTRDNRTDRAAGHYAADRIGRVVRQARAIGHVTATSVALWVSDENENDQVDLYETGRVYFDPDSDAITYEYFVTTGKTTPASAVATSTLTTEASLKTAMECDEKQSVVLAKDVASTAFSGYPSKTQARIVSVEFKMN